MKNIELFKYVRLIQDFTYTDYQHKTILYKKGLTGLVIDYCTNKDYVYVDLDSDDYDDDVVSWPIKLLEYK